MGPAGSGEGVHGKEGEPKVFGLLVGTQLDWLNRWLLTGLWALSLSGTQQWT